MLDFDSLTIEDIEDACDSGVFYRGQFYYKEDRVTKLSFDEEKIRANVIGSENYRTVVSIEDDELVVDCTCPYEGFCKHGVAVLLEFLSKERMSDSDEDDDEDEPPVVSIRQRKPRGASKRTKKDPQKQIEEFLHALSAQQMRALFLELARYDASVRTMLLDRATFDDKTTTKFIAKLRKSIDTISSLPAWTDRWNHTGSTPDYSNVRDGMRLLLSQHHADEVVSLGGYVFENGLEQIESSDDDGETAQEISECMEIVFDALEQSTMQPNQKILWVIDAALRDQYDLIGWADEFLNQNFAAAEWNIVADTLSRQLEKANQEFDATDYSSRYHRDKRVDMFILALRRAGRTEEIIPLCEREAIITQSYERLVQYLFHANRSEEALDWIRKGIASTTDEYTGIASNLRDCAKQHFLSGKNYERAASIVAEDFFSSPSFELYRALHGIMKRMEEWEAGRKYFIAFLETGKNPMTATSTSSREAATEWILKPSGIPLERRRHFSEERFPLNDILIDVAIYEVRPLDVYQLYLSETKNQKYRWFGDTRLKVAAAIEEALPKEAISIYKLLAEDSVAETKRRGYENAVRYLKKILSLYAQLDAVDEWSTYLSDIRMKNKKKITFIKLTDALSIIPGKKKLK